MARMKLPTRRSALIVADGPSAEVLRHRTLPQQLYVIGVNMASVWLPRCDAFFTCFPDHRMRFLMNNRRVGTRYFAAVPPAYGSVFSTGDQFGPRERNVTFFTRMQGYGMNPDPARINGGNSVFGALGMCHHMDVPRIAIIGMDGNDEPRVSGGRPSLPDLNDLMSSYDGNAEVVNGSPRSTVEAFPKMGPGEAIAWLL